MFDQCLVDWCVSSHGIDNESLFFIVHFICASVLLLRSESFYLKIFLQCVAHRNQMQYFYEEFFNRMIFLDTANIFLCDQESQ